MRRRLSAGGSRLSSQVAPSGLAEVANAILDGIEARSADIFPDSFAVDSGEQFQSSPKASEDQIAAMIAEAWPGLQAE